VDDQPAIYRIGDTIHVTAKYKKGGTGGSFLPDDMPDPSLIPEITTQRGQSPTATPSRHFTPAKPRSAKIINLSEYSTRMPQTSRPLSPVINQSPAKPRPSKIIKLSEYSSQIPQASRPLSPVIIPSQPTTQRGQASPATSSSYTVDENTAFWKELDVDMTAENEARDLFAKYVGQKK
jgi:hypothetical protein